MNQPVIVRELQTCCQLDRTVIDQFNVRNGDSYRQVKLQRLDVLIHIPTIRALT